MQRDLDNPMHTGLQAHQMRNEKRAEREVNLYRELRASFVTALFANPLTVLRTPAYIPPYQTALDIVADQCDSERDSVLAQMLHLVCVCAEGEDTATRLPAAAIVARLAHAYADTHAHDAATDEANDEA